MASAVSAGGAIPSTVSAEERRWVVVGVCLNKVLTPALRDVLANEMPIWYQKLLQLPYEIDKQTSGIHRKGLPPSALKLNYESINNNTAHKPRSALYDYAVKDPLSLAKLFVKPFMANFTGFDHTMDASAVLSVICEAQPFIASGAAGIAKKVRSDIRNEWAHCNFPHWTEPTFQAALQSMATLIKKTNLTPVEEGRLLDELQAWEKNGLHLCFGQAVDPILLKLITSEVAELAETVEDQGVQGGYLKDQLEAIRGFFLQEIEDLKQKQARTDESIHSLERGQLALRERCMKHHMDTTKDVEKLKKEIDKIPDETPYVFKAPKRSPWFTGRESELKDLQGIFESEERIRKEKVVVAAVSGLGGSGKTSLVAEHAQRMKDYYQGGVYWFSGEDDIKLADSVNEVADRFGTLQDNSFETTLLKTLGRISRVQKPWLVVVDDMDELNLSPGVLKLVSGPWQQEVTASGRIIITTRRKPLVLSNDIPGFEESCSLRLECFGTEEAKSFVFQRTGIVSDEKTSSVAHSLVQELGRLPLALEQACAYIRYLDCSLSSYLEDYNKQSMKLLNEQKASPVSLYESPERRAVCTTWLLNFEHIKKNKNGLIASRFFNACAFMNPNEIQQELINVGNPPVEDGAYRDFVSTSTLGSRQVLKLLTDFSLFKEMQDSSLGVHKLVQEVIRENLRPDEKIESFVDAVRMVNFVFSKCPSPDDLLTSVVNDCGERSSIRSTDPSFFYRWHKVCLHSHELLKNLKAFLTDSSCGSLFLPETARVVYQCAIHINVNGNIREAKTIAELAYRVLFMSNKEVSEQRLVTLFPHKVPLPEPVRRYIQYSCGAPLPPAKPFNGDPQHAGTESEQREALEKMRLEGNELYKEGRFKESVEVYSCAIDMRKGGTSFDSRLLSNRASAYLKLGDYDNALKDAQDYIEQCPECCKGYARKALALKGLNKTQEANCAAALAFYFERKIFRDFPLFKANFSKLKECIFICEDLSSLFTSLSPFRDVSIDDRIIVLKPGEYHLPAEFFHSFWAGTASKGMLVDDCILLGVGNSVVKPGVTLYFPDSFGIFSQSCMAVNISFVFDKGFWHAGSGSIVKVSNCSFTSNAENVENVENSGALFSEGKLRVENCRFVNCKASGLCIAGQAEVESSVFSGNDFFGLQVFPGGNLVVKHSKLYGNTLGIYIAAAWDCVVLDCEIYDNKKQGIAVTNSTKVILLRNRIYHNDRHGILLDASSFAVIEENIIFENSWFGINTMIESWCRISRNEIHHNKCGGVYVAPITPVEGRQSVVEFNKIFGNDGPGIDETPSYRDTPGQPTFPGSQDPEDLLKHLSKQCQSAILTENELKDNDVAQSPSTSTEVVSNCFFCHKKGKLRKCTRCFTAGYCSKQCQKNHWKKHKSNCQLLLKESSVLIKVLPKSFGDGPFYGIYFKSQAPGLQPLGPEYAKAPEEGTRFIVKIQACDGRRISNGGASLVTVYDRSLTFDGGLDWREHHRIYDLVRQCGFNCALYGWKKLYLWALEANCELRVFLDEHLPLQTW